MNPNDLLHLTKNYIKSFDKKDLESVSKLLSNDFVLEDPVVKRVKGKEEALEKINEIFLGSNKLSFIAKNLYQQGNTTIIEFSLELDGTSLFGVDIIEWEGDKMKELRAYLDIPK